MDKARELVFRILMVIVLCALTLWIWYDISTPRSEYIIVTKQEGRVIETKSGSQYISDTVFVLNEEYCVRVKGDHIIKINYKL